MNSANLTAVFTGLAAAFATVIVGLISARNTRRDIRENLRRDVELAQKLAEGSRTRKILDDHIELQVERLATREPVQHRRYVELAMFALAEGALVANLVWRLANNDELRESFLPMAAVISVLAFVAAATARRRGDRRRREAIEEKYGTR